jgi:hypothetical protein
MTQLKLTDLPMNAYLDVAACEAIQGGMFPMSSIVAFIETMQFTQNAATFTLVNDGTGGSVLNNISHSALSAASPMSFVKMSTPLIAPIEESAA